MKVIFSNRISGDAFGIYLKRKRALKLAQEMVNLGGSLTSKDSDSWTLVLVPTPNSYSPTLKQNQWDIQLHTRGFNTRCLFILWGRGSQGSLYMTDSSCCMRAQGRQCEREESPEDQAKIHEYILGHHKNRQKTGFLLLSW